MGTFDGYKFLAGRFQILLQYESTYEEEIYRNGKRQASR